MAAPDEPFTSLFGKKQPPQIRRSELNELIQMVESADSSLAQFAEAVSRHPVVLKQLMRAANSSLTGSAVEITKPAHAAIYLGSRRVVFLLSTLPPEIINEDISDSTDPR
jgi:HD-like signal output (HDOD) protein